MLCRKCAEIYNLEGLVSIGDRCDICKGIWDRIDLSELPSRRVSIRISGFDDSKYLLQPKTTLNRAIKDLLKQRYGLEIDNTDPDVYIDISPDGVEISRAELFVFGRYWKLRNYVSQKRWRGKNISSVEESIGKVVAERYGARDYKMHASGREDIDAFNIGGRPFVLELIEPQHFQVSPELINTNGITAIIYGRVRRVFRSLVSDSHFDKGYLCTHRELDDAEIVRLNDIRNIKVSQYTPRRVERRRVLKTRYRKIYSIRAFRNFSYIYAEAGTYIKEFFHGDGGRTRPSVSEILNKNTECLSLTVSRIYDRFLDIAYRRYRL
ncbi:MAG: hypothetical protein NZ908_00460 [Candidatus Micrarchaeota archaeon]|nr:hypothetical protein [Candidatus Micrarchaeota archaeon]MCX8154561.1 hypothetical protein [Candidatus Micrarchaeota archaeon]